MLMPNLVIVKNSKFAAITCNYYSDGKGQFFMTRQQIGEALEYNNPLDAIYRIHERHKKRLDQFSVIDKLTSADNKKYETYLYNAKGVYEICRWSHQPKADDFYDHVYDILEGLRLGYLKLEVEKQTTHWQNTRLESKANRRLETDEIKRLVEYAKSQGSKNADKYYITFSKLANKAVGLDSGQRDNTTARQLNNLTLIENIINNVIKDGITKKVFYKEIYQDCKNRINSFLSVAYLEAV